MELLTQITLIDILIAGLFGYFVWSGYHQGLVLGILNLIRTLAAFFLSLTYYPVFGDFLVGRFGLAKPVGQILAFIAILIAVELLLGFLIATFHNTVVRFLFRFRPLYITDKVLGVAPSLLIGFILIITFTLLPIILPVAGSFKRPIENSLWGKYVIPKAVVYEPLLESLIKRLPTRNLIYIVTKTPQSEETVPIQIPRNTTLKTSPSDEGAMLVLLNKERKTRGLNPLVMDQKLVEVARQHSQDMFARGYFSHYNPEKETPFDRMDKGGVEYNLAGENLAYAPTVEIAHQGLMNSPGHRENILKAGYEKVGIGVIDAGFYGKMFTQNFTD